MKILFIAPFETNGRFKGGITSFAKDIENYFKENETKIEFLKLNSSLVKRKQTSNGKFSFKNFINFILLRKKIAHQVKKEQPDVIYFNTSYGISLLKDLMALKRHYKSKCKVFIHIHFADADTILTKHKMIRNNIIRNINKKLTDIVFLSSKTKDDFAKYLINVKPHLLYNYFSKDLNPKIKKDDKILNLLFLGSLEKRKGFYDILAAINEIENKDSIRLTICGVPIEDQAKNEIQKYKNENWFDFKGYTSGQEKDNILSKADILLLPSYSEGLPISILEALKFGVFILSSNVGAIPEIIGEKNGKLIKPGDTEKIKDIILWALTHKSSIREIQKNNVVYSAQFEFEIFVKNWISLFL